MQWLDERLIAQILAGIKRATVRPLTWHEGLDRWNTPLRVGAIYRVVDGEARTRAWVRVTEVALVRWDAIPERLWRADPGAEGEASRAAFRRDHRDFFEEPGDDYEFLAIYFTLAAEPTA